MELNREQIIKALECCTYGGDKTKSQVEVCSPCPYFHEGNCTDILKENALALIKELTEERKDSKIRALRAEGEWLGHYSKAFGDEYYICSHCNTRSPMCHKWNYCPFCGAKMNGELYENGKTTL